MNLQAAEREGRGGYRRVCDTLGFAHELCRRSRGVPGSSVISLRFLHEFAGRRERVEGGTAGSVTHWGLHMNFAGHTGRGRGDARVVCDTLGFVHELAGRRSRVGDVYPGYMRRCLFF